MRWYQAVLQRQSLQQGDGESWFSFWVEEQEQKASEKRIYKAQNDTLEGTLCEGTHDGCRMHNSCSCFDVGTN